MKQVILALAIVLGISVGANAQSSSMSGNMQGHKMEMKKGVKMVNNKPMLCNGSKCAPLTKTYTCTDGCKVTPDGTVTKPDGTTMKLKNGYEIDKNGKVAMIPHGEKGHVCNEHCPMYHKMHGM